MFLERYEIIFAPGQREVTGHEIILASDSRELSDHGTPMFPCGAYIVDLSRFGGGILPWHHHEIVSGAAGSVLQQHNVRPLISCGTLAWIPLRSENAWELEALKSFKKAHDACGAEEFGYELAVREGLSRIWLLIVQNMKTALEREKQERPADTGRIKAMLGYLYRHYREPLTIRDIAAAANVGERECLSCFAEAIGAPPMLYLLKYRVSVSACLLAETDTPIIEICGLTGFDDPSYFSKSFKRFLGVTPSGYRKKYGSDHRNTR